jgi:hypothetical protein
MPVSACCTLLFAGITGSLPSLKRFSRTSVTLGLETQAPRIHTSRLDPLYGNGPTAALHAVNRYLQSRASLEFPRPQALGFFDGLLRLRLSVQRILKF